jgi:sulfur relay protein TusB/DsrH
MPTLFILHRSDPTRWDLAFKLAKSGDAVVLIQDGVVVTARAAEDSGIENLVQRGVKILALKADMDARKLNMKHDVEGINYEQVVDLLIRYDRTYS